MNIHLPAEHFESNRFGHQAFKDFQVCAESFLFPGIISKDLSTVSPWISPWVSWKMIIAQEAGVVCWELPGCGAWTWAWRLYGDGEDPKMAWFKSSKHHVRIKMTSWDIPPFWTNHGEVTNPNVGPGTLWFVKAWRKPLLMANGFQQPQRISWAWLLPPLKLRILGLGQGGWIVSYCIPIFGTAGSMPLETCLKQRPKFCLFGNVVQTCSNMLNSLNHLFFDECDDWGLSFTNCCSHIPFVNDHHSRWFFAPEIPASSSASFDVDVQLDRRP